MSAPLSINQAADLVDLSIQKVFEKSAEVENVYSKYFNVRTTSDYYEKDSSLYFSFCRDQVAGATIRQRRFRSYRGVQRTKS